MIVRFSNYGIASLIAWIQAGVAAQGALTLSWAMALVILGLSSISLAQEEQPPSPPSSKPVMSLHDLATPPNRWLLVICGLPGDAEHRERLTKATQQIAEHGPRVFGIREGQRRVLAGDEEMVSDVRAELPDCQVATQASIEKTIAEIAEQLGPQDSCWVFVLGHGNFHNRHSYLNIEEQDIHEELWARLVGPLVRNAGKASLTGSFPEEQTPTAAGLMWFCQPASGYWLRSLANTNSVLISATAYNSELTGTEMPYALGDVLAGESLHQPLDDIDQDGKLSLLDLYLAVTLEVALRFEDLEFLQTEHARLDDNGNGRGSDLQAAYLYEKLSQPVKRKPRSAAKPDLTDGRVASSTLISQP